MATVHIFRRYTQQATYGNLFIFDNSIKLFECVCLEKPWRNNRKNESSIPANGYTYQDVNNSDQISGMQVNGGSRALAPEFYTLKYEHSAKFNRKLWEIYDVPNRSECKFHVANYVFQLEGCIAPGIGFIDLNADGIPDVTSSGDTLNAFNRILDQKKEHKLVVSHESY